MKHFRLFPVVVVAFLLIACNNSLPTPASKPVSTSPVSTPVSVAKVTSPIPTPVPGQGVVTGFLIDQRTGFPAVTTILYLEPSLDHNVPPLLYGPLNHQPKTTSLEDGYFAITNVPPGEYILALYSPVDILFYQKEDGSAVLVQVKPGEINDLGKVITFIP